MTNENPVKFFEKKEISNTDNAVWLQCSCAKLVQTKNFEKIDYYH